MNREKRRSAFRRVLPRAIGFVLAVLVIGHACVSAQIIEEGVLPREPEAGKWFLKEGASGLCREGVCRGPESPERLVERLYTAGAVYVGVVYVEEKPAGLRVYLALDPRRRQNVFAIASRVSMEQGYGALYDNGQDFMTIWF